MNQYIYIKFIIIIFFTIPEKLTMASRMLIIKEAFIESISSSKKRS